MDNECVDLIKTFDGEVNDRINITQISSSMNLNGGRRRIRGMCIVRLGDA